MTYSSRGNRQHLARRGIAATIPIKADQAVNRFATKPALARQMIAAAVDAGARRVGGRRRWSPRPVPLHTLVRVAGSRWSIEELFQTGKGQVGLDHYQVRGWTGWHRFITLAMLALAVLTVLAAEQPDTCPEIIALTVAEIRRLLNAFVLAVALPPAHTLHWSTWRRSSQARAGRSHYQRRQAK
jgi:hypothetical protein